MALLKRTRQLAEAVAASFGAVGFTPADLLQGPINLTDLAWQAPALEPDCKLRGAPLTHYLDYPLGVDSRALYDFYSLGLYALAHGSERHLGPNGWAQLGAVFGGASSGERKCALSVPDRWPEIDENAAIMFGLECAHVFKTSGKCLEFISGKDDYYAVTTWGRVGIVEGRLSLMADYWDTSVAGFVQALLQQPRGIISTECHYDIIARLRSVLFEKADIFGEFEALDMALQTLRIWCAGSTPKELVHAVSQISYETLKRRTQMASYDQAIATMENWHLSDRVKIGMLIEILVPTCMPQNLFNKVIINMHSTLPPVLHSRVEQRIRARLKRNREQLGALDAASATRKMA